MSAKVAAPEVIGANQTDIANSQTNRIFQDTLHTRITSWRLCGSASGECPGWVEGGRRADAGKPTFINAGDLKARFAGWLSPGSDGL